jgi:YVTN family beta-propeller protein
VVLSVWLGIVLLAAGSPQEAYGQSVTGTITTGTYPAAVAVNPVTDKVYVANANSNSVTVIDGATNAVASTVPVGTNPAAVAVNPVTDEVYVANFGSNTVTVIDGATNAVASTVAVGTNPEAVAVNPVTDQVYVADKNSNTVTVIDGAKNTVASTVTVGTNPEHVAVNPVTDQVYVANFSSSGTVTVIDGATNAVASTVTVGLYPDAMVVNPVTDQVYVANYDSSTVSVIDGATNTVASTVAVGKAPDAVVVNPVTDQVYVANYSSGNVSVIDGATNTVASTVAVGTAPDAIAVNPVTDQVYAANLFSGTVTVIDGATNAANTVTVGANPDAVAVNPVTDQVYVANSNSNSVTVIDGATNTVASTDTVGTNPFAGATNPVTGNVYVANSGSNTVTVIDGATNAASTVSVGSQPDAVAVNPVTDTVYVANYSSRNVTVIDGATNATSTVTVGSEPDAVAVNPVTDQVYIANQNPGSSGTVTVIDGATNTTSTVTVGFGPKAVAVNSETDKVYVANESGNTVTVIDGATNATSTVSVGSNPVAVAVNPETDKVYVANGGSDTVTVIDGATNATSTVAAGTGPAAVAVNPVTDKVYVANSASSSVTVIDGATNTVANTVTVGSVPDAVAVNPVTDQAYVPNISSNNVTVIDGATNTASTVSVGSQPAAVAVNPVTDKVYVANSASSSVTVIDAEGIQPVPITLTAAGVSDALTTGTSNNVFQTMNTQPSFTVQATSAFSTSSAYSGVTATNPPPTELYYSVDGGQWSETATTSTSGSNPAGFSIAPGQQSLGFHTLYYYVGYGNEGGQNSSSQYGTGNSPEISNVEAYHFLVEPLSTTTSVVADVNPQNVGSYVTFTATVTPFTTSSTLTGTVQFYDGTTALGKPVTVQNSGGVYLAAYATSSLAEGTHTIEAVYSGDTNDLGSSGSMTEQIAGAATTLTTTSGSGQSAVIGTAFANPVVVSVLDSSGIPVPNATVTFSGTGLSFSPAVASTNSSGEASTTATPTQGGALTGTTAVTGATTSATFSETGLPLSATVVVAPASTVYGTAATTMTANVVYTGTAAPTGGVSFTLNGGSPVTASCTGATSPLTCTASYPTAGLSVSGGPYNIVASLAADMDYDAVTASNMLVVNPAPLKVTANNATKVYGTANPAFTGAVTGTVNGNTFSESFTTTATATSSAGPYPIVPSVTGTDLSDYAVTTSDGTLVVSQAGSAVSLTSSTANANLNANVTFTATVTSATTGTPTGSVEFLDGSTVLGSGPLNSIGTATYTTSSLTAGLHQITAVYQGDVNFDESTSAPLAQIVTAPDFGLTTNVNTLTLKEGQTGDVTISLDPVGGFKGSVQFTCSGLAANSQCTFSPASLTADGSNAKQTDQMTITTKGPNTGTVAMIHRGNPDGVMLAGIFWLPGLLVGGLLFWQRKKLTAKYRVFLILLVAAAVISGAVGCGSTPPYTAPGASLVTVTATSGSSSHTAIVYLDVTK